MRIAFADLIPYDYRVESVYKEPLGGTQSALCYLAEALAQRGHQVFVFTEAHAINLSLGVICLPLKLISRNFFASLKLDVLILQSSTAEGKTIKPMLEPQTKLLFWAQHAHDQPGTSSLAESETQASFDYIAMVSDWQKESFIEAFGIPFQKLKVMRNAIAPCFANLFEPRQSVLQQKSTPPVLAYTSTPFRGLDLLLEMFPQIRQAVPGTRLKVFSSMKVYQVPAERDQFQHLYEVCQQLEGAEYIGSLPQPQLAEQLKSITVLAYPNHFPETSCIAVMEAMGSGCAVITTDLAALPETTAGFAHLVPVPADQQFETYKKQFVEKTIAVLQQYLNQPAAIEEQLQAQVRYIKQQCTWRERVQEWETWLNEICAAPEAGRVEIATNWQHQAHQFWHQGDYKSAIALYEEQIAVEPEQIAYYWDWGILLILAGREEEAHLTWSMLLAEAEPELAEEWVGDLGFSLNQAAEVQAIAENWQLAWALRYYLQEFKPNHLDNLLLLIQYSIQLETLAEHEVFLEQAIALLDTQQITLEQLRQTPLFEIVEQLILKYAAFNLSLQFTKTCLKAAPQAEELKELIIFSTLELVQNANQNLAISQSRVVDFLNLCLSFAPNEISVLSHLIGFSPKLGEYQKAISLSEHLLGLATDADAQVMSYYFYLRSLLASGGEWQKAELVSNQYYSLLADIVDKNIELNTDNALQLSKGTTFFSYIDDQPERLHRLRKQIGNYSSSRIKECYREASIFCQNRLQQYQKNTNKKIRIGYISSCFSCHAVGYLVRWIFGYHDYEKFDIFVYSLARKNDFIQQFITNQVSNFFDLSEINDQGEIAQIISKDEIDILIDLDSITYGKTCIIMALKPAPIQITWLGFDAVGLTAIDYFLADPYVLPSSADSYYTEKIWRLPQTYIAVDGFESTVPNLRRADLDISDSAVTYYTSQVGFKRHPQTTRLQLEILKRVENSYLLIKGSADESSVKEFFQQIADEVGVSHQRMRFLDYAPSPEIHRANMAIADIALDTYPYNGATTTLETLWMGVPLVTKVGEQFAARNSYGFLVNAGVSEGIAWTDDEYVEWGVRFGNDPQLRQDVAWKLRVSRQTSPLWNARKFTLELEKAFKQMWERY
jgi:predicted O-linked N-acetylglucosamine transferase (SPINDLY family)